VPQLGKDLRKQFEPVIPLVGDQNPKLMDISHSINPTTVRSVHAPGLPSKRAGRTTRSPTLSSRRTMIRSTRQSATDADRALTNMPSAGPWRRHHHIRPLARGCDATSCWGCSGVLARVRLAEPGNGRRTETMR
jgi:hypothetical protein